MLWLKALLICVQTSLLAKLCQGAVECICSTADCISDGTNTCTAEEFCYVQSMINPLAGGEKTPIIIRGCIDDRTPLLCENRRPELKEINRAAWPVLHCCKDKYCNRDVIPTPLPDDPAYDDRYEYEEYPDDENDDDEAYNSDDFFLNMKPDKSVSVKDEIPEYRDTSNTDSRKFAINPLYIGVPVAGACVLLAIIIFAIYILKRQNRYLEDHYRNNLRQQGCVKPLTQDGKEPVCTCRETCPYPDCERSSNGSETRLLMKV